MTIKLLMKKLHLSGKEFFTDDDLKGHCKPLKLDYTATVNYLLRKRYLLRIFRGVFYLRSLDEVKLGRAKYSHLELVSRGLDLKGVRNWYFGLYTALKLNNMTHEHFAVEYVVNDRIFRAKPIAVAGVEFKFHRLKAGLLEFGVVEDGGLRYSDPEKTILDFIHVWRYNGVPRERIVMDLSDYAKGVSKKKMKEYARSYSKSVGEIAGEVMG